MAGGLCTEEVFVLSSSSLSVQDSLSKTFSVTGRIKRKWDMSGSSHLEHLPIRRMRCLFHYDSLRPSDQGGCAHLVLKLSPTGRSNWALR